MYILLDIYIYIHIYLVASRVASGVTSDAAAIRAALARLSSKVFGQPPAEVPRTPRSGQWMDVNKRLT